MNRSITPWSIVLGAALIALPASGLAQTPPQQPPQQQSTPEQPPATPPSQAQPAATQPPATDPQQAQAAQHGEHSAAEHLAKAKSALNEIETAAVTGRARTRLNELKRHVSALDRTAAAGPEAGKSGSAKPGSRSWATEVAAIDRILTELTTPVTSAADAASATGTTGTAGKAGTTSQSAVTVDEPTRAKLLEVRTHITAFASAMSGTSPAPDAASPAGSTPRAEPATTGTPATPSPTEPATQTPTATPPPTQPQSNPPSTEPQSTPPSTPPQTTPPSTQPQTAPPSTQPTTPATQQPPTTTPADPAAPAAAGNVDPEAARRHLTEARDVLSQVTQMPEATQLTGDTRTQVAQLITNFNELITTQTEWRATYAKLQANLTALIGAEKTDEANVPPPATGTAGAVGTSGSATLDAKIREKLVEFRTKLAAFERAAGGTGSDIPK
jgi:hypothetical protein